MFRAMHSRRTLIAVAALVAFIAIVIPTCQMVGCSMSGGAMSWGNMSMPGFFGTCGGNFVVNQVPPAVIPPNGTALVLALVAMLIVAPSLLTPRVHVQLISAHDSDPPPDPLDPRGESLRI